MIKKIIKERLPKHIAIIMDGNGRWAKARHLPRTQGHIEGSKRVEEIIEIARDIGINVLTLYTFSTENWSRPKTEVELIMNMLDKLIKQRLEKLNKGNIKLQIIGRTDHIPQQVLKTIKEAIEATSNNTGLILNLAFNYGSRQEIIDGVRNIAYLVNTKKLRVEEINEQTISANLYTHNLPDPDLLIRTSGEIRISNFLLWQLSYAELYFTEKFWPDFNKEEFIKAVLEFQNRERRFGDIATKKG